MKYRVFKRGTIYRIANPRMFFWHWVRMFSGLGAPIWESEKEEEAFALADELNWKEIDKDEYDADYWKEVNEF